MLQHSKYEADRVATSRLDNGENFPFITLLRNVFVYELSLSTLNKLFENTAKNYSIKCVFYLSAS